jgi:hypothetical protein
MSRKIPATNSIGLYFHCGRCLGVKPKEVSPSDYSRIEVGWTKLGLQVWCKRCNVNVVHIDFEGMKHPANLAAVEKGARS